MARHPRHNQPLHTTFFFELVKIAFIAIIVVLPIRLFIAQPFIVSGSSMQPTFESGDYLIIDQLSYRLEKPQRQDVIVFRYPEDPSKYFIKRVIGLPGETVVLDGSQVVIQNENNPDGFVLDEPYVTESDNNPNETMRVTLEDDEYFVLGDNRQESSDSRMWGELPRGLVVGRAFTQLLPVNEITLFPGHMK